MLRVSYSDTPDGQRWSLCGRLAGLWVQELRACWRQARERAPLARAVVDLKDVIFIDEAGELLLAEMEIAGTELLAAGVENKHVIATLRNGASRPLRRRLEDLCARREEEAKPSGG
jgi:nucleoside-triphosphatase THEP1